MAFYRCFASSERNPTPPTEWCLRNGDETLLRVPYGEGVLPLRLRLQEDPHVLLPGGLPEVRAPEDPLEYVERSLNAAPFRELVPGRQEAAIVVDDDTRPRYAKALLVPLLDFLERNGVRKAEVIVATGLHRPLNESRIQAVLGGLPAWVEVHNHDPYHDLCELGEVGGRRVLLNRRFMSAPLKVVIGDVELHQIFGYGGGAKSLVPGLSDAATIAWLHSFLTHPSARPGVLRGNPVQEFLKQTYARVRVDFSLQAVLNRRGQIQCVHAGSIREAFLKGVAVVDGLYKLQVREPFDVLIASAGGYPRDLDLYQTQKVINMARVGLKKSGRLILFSECGDGIGPEVFSRWLEQAPQRQDVQRMVKQEFEMGLHKLYLLAEGTRDAEVYLYSSLPPEVVRRAFLVPLKSPEEAADLVRGRRVGFVPFGAVTLLRKA